ncbi:magnesium transporter CorA family protein [Pseudomaricurvus sp. HS19]|uniref:magnesium transporter CorA family protein n=1 Tax=Pseudomaricurvus sp. HS19 TaxID=2692626 RepID=UPI00136B8886|nr:metal transporter [Pseudomaricurvus sp. HS19]
MIKSYLLLDGEISTSRKQDLLQRWREATDSILWLDIQFQHPISEDIRQLLESLGCHLLAIKDVTRKRHPPKLEVFDDQMFVLYRGIHQINDTLDFDHQQIGFFIGARLLITIHPQVSLGINTVAEAGLTKELLASPLQLALKIMHTSAGIYLDQVLLFEDELSILEDQLYSGKGEVALGKLAACKAQLIKLKRTFGYHRSVSHQLRMEQCSFLPTSDSVHHHQIIDLDDRFERLLSLTQMHYDMCGDMIDSYISITSHQLNITMRVLTVITAIFVPLSFLAGVYGMNFEYIPELRFHNGYFMLLGTMALIATSLALWFKHKQWF